MLMNIYIVLKTLKSTFMIGAMLSGPSASDEKFGPCFPLHVSFLLPHLHSLVEDIRRPAK